MAEAKKTTAATVKADIAKTAAELAEGSKKTVEEVKKAATKASETVKKATTKKPAAKKATAAKKTTTAKKATATKPEAKKAPAKKVEAKVSVNLQYGGLDVNMDEIIKKVKKAQKDCKKYEIYVKPEEGKAYYVADGQLGDVQL